ncbi:hypothetical protein [Pseudomonas fluorescens]|uniref:hypothetical protein n=1 Tax=Pseudomonas fluorescens TaxID=294 RepID=UPI0010E1EE22|nr:hypothetical protein [Pseudomonas fluorescens]TCV62850.1 hypothetical protein EDB98_112158 [Pseudomonas fluorescens]
MHYEPVHKLTDDLQLRYSHYREIIEQRKRRLFPNGEEEGFADSLLLDRRDRPHYLAALAGISQLEIDAGLGERGIITTEHLREHIELVHQISAECRNVPAFELRLYSLDLLRAMKAEMVDVQKSA